MGTVFARRNTCVHIYSMAVLFKKCTWSSSRNSGTSPMLKSHKRDNQCGQISCWTIQTWLDDNVRTNPKRRRPCKLSVSCINVITWLHSSGHSSNAFCSMTYLVLYLMGKLHILSENSTSSIGASLVALSPIAVAIFVAVSRTVDYHHHFSGISRNCVVNYEHIHPCRSGSWCWCSVFLLSIVLSADYKCNEPSSQTSPK